jgi:isoamylase
MLQTPSLRSEAWPLGAHCRDEGTNFAVFSANAQAIELCLFDETGERQTNSVFLTEKTNQIWHVFLPNVGEGLVYGLRAHGDLNPKIGYRFDAQKILLDPYAKDVFRCKEGTFRAV